MPDNAARLDADFGLLLSRDPYSVINGKMTDKVQDEVFSYFNAAAQYHMNSDLRGRFISAGVPNVSPELRPFLAGDEVAAFYRDLSVPYVAMTLKASTDPAVKRLNTARAERRISDSMRSSKVYRAQAQAFYALAWEKQFPEAARFKADQRQNSRDYKSRAEDDLKAFIDKQCQPEDENSKILIRGFLKTYLQEAQSGKYWAFRALLTYLSDDNLATLDPTSPLHGELTDSANPARKLLRQCSVLNGLDDSGKFATFLQEMMRHRLFGIALPQKLDFKANEKELSVICLELMQEFIKQADTLGPDYAEIRQHVALMLQEDEGKRNIDSMLSLFFGSVTSSGTARSLDGWLKTYLDTANMRELGVLRKWSPKAGLSAAAFVRISGLFMALSGVVTMMSNGVSWSQMTAKERAATIIAGVDLFLISAPKVLSFGVVTLPNSWTSLTTWVKARTTVATKLTRSLSVAELQVVERSAARSRSLSTTTLLRSEELGVQVESGLRKWLTGEMRATMAATGRQALAIGQAGEQVTLVRRFFGRNLDHFMASRVGLVLAISGLALSIWGAATAKDDKERWINIALSAAAAMEVYSIGVGILGTAGLAGRVGSFLGPIGMAVSVVVVGYMIYDALTKAPSPSLIEQFVEGEAKAAKLYMPFEMDIDYLTSTRSLDQGVGVSLIAANSDAGYLQIDLPGSVCAILHKPTHLDLDADTVFDLDVDGQGRATLVSRGYFADADPSTGTPQRPRNPAVLMVDGSNRAVAGPVASLEEDEDACQWESTMLGGVVKVDGKVKAGQFALKNRKSNAYLALVDGVVALSSTPFTWTVETGVPMRKRFSYAFTRFDSVTSDIRIDENQAGIRPIEWTAAGLPDFLRLAEDGTLVIDDVKFDATDKNATWRFTVTAKNAGGSFSSHVELTYQDDEDDDDV
ncbi:hypothetical protein [Ancylobacter sp. IITR112]|uniref:hypothetical protein n=1 Tax=Ancylobacter sp. IITR112 TaxID=3138073 RepID=UPI00352B2C03